MRKINRAVPLRSKATIITAAARLRIPWYDEEVAEWRPRKIEGEGGTCLTHCRQHFKIKSDWGGVHVFLEGSLCDSWPVASRWGWRS